MIATPRGIPGRFLLAASLVLAGSSPSVAALPESPPERLGFDPERLARIDDAVSRAIAERKVPGAVVLVGRRGRLALVRAYGRRAIEPADEPMTRDTIFDLASLTKPVATATSVMVLLERGRLRLDDPIARHLPEFDDHGKGAITIEQLLRHRAGLVADNPMSDFADGPEVAWERIGSFDLVATPGERFLYSDVGYMILGRIVERVSGRPLDAFARENLFEPLGMTDTGFRRIAGELPPPEAVARIAPTTKQGEAYHRGVVHDPRARALGGVAGHAGLFGPADDLAVFVQMLLDGGRGPGGHRVLAPLTVRAMIDPGSTPLGQRRGLGWDVATGFSGPRGSLFGPAGFGHTGFTGTSLWADVETGTFVVILSNAVHPDGKGSVIALRAEVATLVAAAIVDVPIRVEK